MTFVPEPELPTYYFDQGLVSSSGRNFEQNNFVQFLSQYFRKEDVESVILKYFVGTAKNGRTVFWQIDEKLKVRYGKIMRFNAETGKRSKTDFNNVHTVLKIDTSGHEVRQCLFGLHLITETTNSKISIVESEKTAVVMALLKPDTVWMSTGGKGNFKYDYLKPVKGYDLIVWPDNDAIALWKEKAEMLNKYGYKIEVLDNFYLSDAGENDDVVDVVLKDYPKLPKEAPRPVAIEYTSTELAVHKLGLKNAAIYDLIGAFDLVDGRTYDAIRKVD